MVYIHGNYVGPNWSGGKKQGSIPYGRIKATDDFDLSAKFHDDAYATWPHNKLSKADHIFYKHNIGKGAVRTAAALAVKAQGLLRGKQAPDTPKSLMKRPREEADEETTPVKKKTKKEINSKKSPNNEENMPKKNGRKRMSKRSSTVRKRRANKSKSRRKNSLSFKRTKSNPLVKINGLSGSSTMTEYGRTSETTNASIHIGHHDAPVRQIEYVFIQSLLKVLLNKANIYFGSFADATDSQLAGSRFRLTVKKTYGQTAPTDYADIDFPLVPTFPATYHDLAFEWYTVYNAAILADTHPNTWQVWEASFYPGTDFAFSKVVMNMRGARMQLYSDSILRIQNQTLSGTNVALGERENIDRVDINPLVGKGYGGKGNGTLFHAKLSERTVAAGPIEIIATDDFGIIDQFQTNNGLEDPLPAYFYPQCKSEKKHVKIMPGQTIKSYLKGNYSMLVDEMFQKLYPHQDTIQMSKIGKFKFYHLEREITTSNINANIKLAYEHNFTLGCKLKLKRTVTTVPYFNQNITIIPPPPPPPA